MCSKSNTLKSKKDTCKCASACIKTHLKAKRAVSIQAEEMNVVAYVDSVRDAFKNLTFRKIEP